MKQWMLNYFGKMKGVTTSPPRVPFKEVVWSWVGGFLGIMAVALLTHSDTLPLTDQLFLIGSFGASAVLIFGAPHVPYAQPRNLVGGHVFSAVIGVACAQLLPDQLVIASALAVATAIAVMHLTHTIHPPGGASALIAVIGSDKIHQLGYWYAVSPVGVGAVILLVVALLVNNLASHRQYPQFWR